jgi:ATP-dependent Clp protease ATP-binding subunit ClpC
MLPSRRLAVPPVLSRRRSVVSLASERARSPLGTYTRRVFERFTERARQVVVLAQDEARALNHNYIGTEHILLGLLREEEGLAARVLESFDITVEEVRAQVQRLVGQGDEPPTGQIPFTPRAKKVLELALKEALSLGDNYIGTEHVLLGVVRENQGVAARILLDFDVDQELVRNKVIRSLSGPGRGTMQGARARARQSGWTSYGPLARRTPSLLLGWALGTFSLGVGILIGWAIWGQ